VASSSKVAGFLGPRGSLVEALRELHVLRKSQYARHRGIEKLAHRCDKVDWLSDWIGILPWLPALYFMRLYHPKLTLQVRDTVAWWLDHTSDEISTLA